MKLYLKKNTIFNFSCCTTTEQNKYGRDLPYYNMKVPFHIQKILDDRYIDCTNTIISFIGYYHSIYSQENLDVFYTYIYDKLDSDDDSNIENFINSIHIDISEEEYLYLKLKHPNIFRDLA